MPLMLYLPTDYPTGVPSVRHAWLWLEAYRHQCRRAQRFLADRRHLPELDARLLGDVGLTHEDVLRGVPFMLNAKDVA